MRALVKVDQTCGTDTLHIAAVRRQIEIGFKDVMLAVPRFQLQRARDLHQLA